VSPARRAPLEAAILDLDGVVTRTATLHERAWKEAFDPVLAAVPNQTPFSHLDYLRHVDGRPRLDGVRALLAARGVTLPPGAPSDAPGLDTEHALASWKQARFHELLSAGGVEVFDDAVTQLHRWRDEGLSTALVSSSRNAGQVLASAGLDPLFDVRVDGETGESLGLPGKPAPDYFLEAARRLGVVPGRAMVIEDAVSGVVAGRRGGFGLVVGVSREGTDEALRRAGADLVVHRLTEIATRPVQAARELGGDRGAMARR
jgi:alpha,alpha-trehalase